MKIVPSSSPVSGELRRSWVRRRGMGGADGEGRGGDRKRTGEGKEQRRERGFAVFGRAIASRNMDMRSGRS